MPLCRHRQRIRLAERPHGQWKQQAAVRVPSTLVARPSRTHLSAPHGVHCLPVLPVTGYLVIGGRGGACVKPYGEPICSKDHQGGEGTSDFNEHDTIQAEQAVETP